LQLYGGDRPFLVTFLDRGEPLILRHPQDHILIQDALLDTGQEYRAWNTKFDLAGLRQAGYTLPDESLWHDGMVQAHIMDERRPVALAARHQLLFGGERDETEAQLKTWLEGERRARRKDSKASGDRYVSPNYSDVPDEIMTPYAASDVVMQRQIGDVYGPAIEQNEDFRELYDLERRVLRALFWMEDRGVPVDRPALVALEGSLLTQLDAAEQSVQRIVQFDNFNVRSPAQIGEALDRLEADTRFMTRSGSTQNLKVDEENLSACDHPLAEAVLAYRGVHKLWAMVRRMLHGDAGDDLFPAAYLTGEDRLHPNYRQVGARTGRMSCSNPNFQQVHRDDLRLRYCIQASPGKRLVCVDLDQIEAVLLGAFAGEGAFLEAILRGDDVHALTAQRVGLRGRKRSTGAVEAPRDQGKRFNYMMIYGGGVRALRKWFGVSQEEAKNMMDRFHSAYPEVTNLQNRIEFTLEDRGYIKSPWGRRFRVERNAERESYKFLNYLIQGSAADIFKVGTARCHEAGIPLVAAVHDELIAEVDEADAEEAGRVMVEALTDHERVTRKVPITAEAKIVERWSDAKTKGDGPHFEPDKV